MAKKSPAVVDPSAPAAKRKFEVSIEGGFTGVFEAESADEARAAYNKFFGVIRTDRKVTVTEVTGDPDADAPAPAKLAEARGEPHDQHEGD